MDPKVKSILLKQNTKKKLKELNNLKRIRLGNTPKIIESKKYKQKYKPDYNDQVYFFS